MGYTLEMVKDRIKLKVLRVAMALVLGNLLGTVAALGMMQP